MTLDFYFEKNSKIFFSSQSFLNIEMDPKAKSGGADRAVSEGGGGVGSDGLGGGGGRAGDGEGSEVGANGVVGAGGDVGAGFVV